MDKVISAMAERIVREFHPIRIILFGSYARGEADKDSDVDLLVVMPSVQHKRREAVAMRQALADFPVGKDIIVTTPEEINLRGNVVGTILRPAVRDGKAIYERA